MFFFQEIPFWKSSDLFFFEKKPDFNEFNENVKGLYMSIKTNYLHRRCNVTVDYLVAMELTFLFIYFIQSFFQKKKSLFGPFIFTSFCVRALWKVLERSSEAVI